jgi:hypothetical protein
VALDVLHDEELPLVFHEVVADARQRGVAKVVEQDGLALEGFAQRRFVAEEGLLDGDRAVKALVRRDVDRAHAAAPDLSDDAVAVLEQGAGFNHGSGKKLLPGRRACSLGRDCEGRTSRPRGRAERRPVHPP